MDRRYIIRTASTRQPSGTHDDPDITVMLVRHPDGSTSLTYLRGAVCAWVLRRSHLLAADLE